MKLTLDSGPRSGIPSFPGTSHCPGRRSPECVRQERPPKRSQNELLCSDTPRGILRDHEQPDKPHGLGPWEGDLDFLAHSA